MKLFGGAITSDVPYDLRDASDFRPVPDNQEVYVGSLRDSEMCLIIELMEPVPEADLVEALAHHVDEAHRLAGATNDAKDEPTEFFSTKLGHHEFAGRVDIVQTQQNTMLLTFGLFRLPKFKVDVIVSCVITFDKGQCPGPQDRDTQKDTVLRVVESFEVVDPKLFIDEKNEYENKQSATK